MAPEDVQRTLLELTVTSITDAIFKQDLSPGELILCGGGVHNKALVNRLEELAAPWQVKLSSDFGINPDYMEVMAFAWIGKRTLEGLAGNLKAVTGADEDVVLGAIYSAH